MKKIIYSLILIMIIILPIKVNAGIKTDMTCDDKRMDETLKHQIKTCYIVVTASGDTSFYSTSGKFTMINTSLKGNIEAADKRIKITNTNLDNLTFTAETPIKNETIKVAKFTIYLAENGKECRVLWDPNEYGVNYSCQIQNGYYYDKNGNSVSESEYNKQCKPHYCEIIDGTYFDKNGNIVDKTEYSIQCEKHSCEKVGDKYFDKDGNIVTKDEYSIQCEKHSCEVIGDKYFDKDGNIVTKDEYSIQCEKHSCEKVGDKYFDKNGNIVTKDEYSIQCEKHSCEVIGDKYFDKDGNIVTKSEYSIQCEKHSCEIINGVYFGKEGTSVTDVEYDKQCNKHYCKIIDGTYFGKNGDVISKNDYATQCPTNNPHTDASSTLGYILIGLLITTFASIISCFKQNSKKVFKI